MSDGVRLYAGTHEGLFVLRSSGNGGWQEANRCFDNAIFEGVVGSRQHPERVYVAAAHDGVYRTDDAGMTWKKLFEGDVRCVALDPTNDEVVYTGTEPIHLYRSEDRGDEWEEITSLQDMPDDVKENWWFPQPPHEGHVLGVFVHPDDANTIYLCLEHGGIVRSFDRGTTWEDVSKGIDYLDIHFLAALPHSKSRYFVATARGFYAADDPGRGWQRAENGFTRDYFHDFVFLPPEQAGGNPTMLIGTADKSPGYWDRPERAQGAIFRSVDCAQSWQRCMNGLPENMKTMVWALTNHPSDNNTVFAGLGDVARGHAHGTGGPGSLIVSRDRGESWEPVGGALPADRVLWAAAD